MTVSKRVCIVGLEESEVAEIQSLLDFGIAVVAHQALPRIIVKDGILEVESRKRAATIEVDKIVFHGIYESDLDFLAGLALWDGPCLPAARGMIELAGETWLKSIHAPDAKFTEIDPELLADTQNICRGFGLDILANDYIVTDAGTKHLLEVNHIPNVTRFPEIWSAYRDYAVAWINS